MYLYIYVLVFVVYVDAEGRNCGWDGMNGVFPHARGGGGGAGGAGPLKHALEPVHVILIVIGSASWRFLSMLWKLNATSLATSGGGTASSSIERSTGHVSNCGRCGMCIKQPCRDIVARTNDCLLALSYTIHLASPSLSLSLLSALSGYV